MCAWTRAGPAVNGLRLAEEEARHVEDVAPHVGEDELLELGQERLVREELEARDHGEPRPEDAAEAPSVEHGLQGPDRGLPPPVLVDEEGDARLAAGAHHALGGREVVRHRLLADDGLAVGDRELDEAGVGRGVGDDVEEVDVLPAQQLLRVVVDGADAQLAPEGLGLGARAVVEGHAPGPRQLAPGAELVPRPEPGSEQGEAERRSWKGTSGCLRDRRTLAATPGGCPWSARPVQARSPAWAIIGEGPPAGPPSQETRLQMSREDPRCTASPSPSCWP